MRQSNSTCVYTHCYLTCEVPVDGARVSLDADADAEEALITRTLIRPCAFVPREVHTIALHLDTGTLELRGSLDVPFRFLAPLTLFTHSARSYLPATAAASSIVREDMTFRITKQRIQEQEERARKLQAELEETKQELECMRQQSQLMYSFEEMRDVPRCTKEAAPKAPKRESNRKRLRTCWRVMMMTMTMVRWNSWRCPNERRGRGEHGEEGEAEGGSRGPEQGDRKDHPRGHRKGFFWDQNFFGVNLQKTLFLIS